MRVAARSVLLLAVVALLAGCGHARIVQREGGGRVPHPAAAGPVAAPAAVPRDGLYAVRRGDTLYGIAFRHGLDYRDVAAWNRITAPYTIYPGQRLRLAPPAGGRSAIAMPLPKPSAPPPGAPGAFETVSAPGRPAGPDVAPPPASPAAPSSPAPAAGNVAPALVPPPVPVPAVSAGPASAAGWRWPTRGRLIGRYVAGDPKRQGLDIAGNAGQPVLAAADGVVVYSGAGLVGYGELVIIKHSDEWLSAYAHNRRRLVAEGQAVKGGQAIAELGRSGTSRDMLHFEIRRNGKPVDPLPLLPPP